MNIILPLGSDLRGAEHSQSEIQVALELQVSSKIGVIESLIEKVDKIILGGGMIFTFFKARGMGVGSSLVEEDNLDLAKRLEKLAKDKGECLGTLTCASSSTVLHLAFL